MKNSYQTFFDEAQRARGAERPSQAAIQKKKQNKKQIEKQGKTAPKRQIEKGRVLAFLLSVGFVIALACNLFFDEMVDFASRLEIGFYPKAAAQLSSEKQDSKPTNDSTQKEEDTKKEGVSDTHPDSRSVGTLGSAETQNPSGALSAERKASGEQGVESAGPSDRTGGTMDLNHFARLRERKKELDAREEELSKVEAEIANQKREVEQRLKELEDVRRRISSVLEDRLQADDQKTESLVQSYAAMKAEKAAKIFETLDEDLVVEIMKRMKRNKAADIMSFLSVEKAKAISEKTVGIKK